MTDVTVGGVAQRLWFRGMNASSPAVILLRLVWFEHSAHNPPFEEPALFTETLVDLLDSIKAHDSSE